MLKGSRSRRWTVSAAAVAVLASRLTSLRALTNAYGSSGYAGFPSGDGAPMPIVTEGGTYVDAGDSYAPSWDVHSPVVPSIDGSDVDMPQPLQSLH